MSSALELLAIASLIAFGLFALWRARELAPVLCRAAWNAPAALPRLLRNVLVGTERAPRPRHAWQKPRMRITWIARTALYPTLVAAVIWQWNGRTGVGLYASDLELAASAPRQAPADAPLPLRVAASPLGGGTVRTDLHWRALGERSELLAEGDSPCTGATTILLPAAKHVRAVEVLARGPKGRQSVRLDRTGSPPPRGADVATDTAQTRSAARAHALVKTAERQQHCVWMVSRLGLVLIGLWLVAEAGAWLTRRLLRTAARLPWQIAGAWLVLLPTVLVLWHWSDWDLWRSNYRWRTNGRGTEPSAFEEFLLITRAGIDGDTWMFSWSWWLPVDVDSRR